MASKKFFYNLFRVDNVWTAHSIRGVRGVDSRRPSFLSRASSRISLMISDLVRLGSPEIKSKIALSPGTSLLSVRVIRLLGITTWFSGLALSSRGHSRATGPQECGDWDTR